MITSKRVPDSESKALSVETKASIKKIIGSPDRLLLITIIAIIATGLLIGLVAIGAYIGNSANATFETYENPSHGIRIQYPSNWKDSKFY